MRSKIIQSWHGHLMVFHPTKTRNTELPQAEEKARTNTSIEMQCCLTSTKLSSATANEFCITFFGSFKDETCYI